MDLTPYVDGLRRDLLASAADDTTRQVAERLAQALGPAVRLALMEAVSQAATEITAEMAGGGVDVRLDGRDLDFVVHHQPPAPAVPAPPSPPAPPAHEGDEDGGTARITLRLPESLKNRAEEAAAGAGHSLNTWLVAAVREATREDRGGARVDVDLSSLPFPGGFDPFGRRTGRRTTGWL